MRWDSHIHSKYSPDCRTRISDIVKAAKKFGLDGVVLTDHESLEGWREMRTLCKKNNIGTVVAYEYKTNQGDLLVFGAEQLLPPFLDADEAVERARQMGAILVAPHPFDLLRRGLGRHIGRLNLDGIETVNSHSIYGNRKAQNTARKFGLPELGGSDAHIWREIGQGYTLFEGDFLKAIRQKKTAAGGKFYFKNLPIALGSGILTVPKRLRIRWKKWSVKRRLTRQSQR